MCTAGFRIPDDLRECHVRWARSIFVVEKDSRAAAVVTQQEMRDNNAERYVFSINQEKKTLKVKKR